MGEMISDWRAHAEASELAKLVERLRPGELDLWLDSATPRLPETVRVNPCREDVSWTQEKLEHEKRKFILLMRREFVKFGCCGDAGLEFSLEVCTGSSFEK